MIKLEKLSSYIKAVLAMAISENVVEKLEKGDGYECCRSALDSCWEWIEHKNIEKYDPWNLCFYLGHESGVDLIYYSDTEEKGDIYCIVFATVAYIARLQFIEKKYDYPEYLEGADDEYYQMIIDTAIHMEDCGYEEKDLSKIIEYCSCKIKEDSEFIFCRKEISEMIPKLN